MIALSYTKAGQDFQIPFCLWQVAVKTFAYSNSVEESSKQNYTLLHERKLSTYSQCVFL